MPMNMKLNGLDFNMKSKSSSSIATSTPPAPLSPPHPLPPPPGAPPRFSPPNHISVPHVPLPATTPATTTSNSSAPSMDPNLTPTSPAAVVTTTGTSGGVLLTSGISYHDSPLLDDSISTVGLNGGSGMGGGGGGAGGVREVSDDSALIVRDLGSPTSGHGIPANRNHSVNPLTSLPISPNATNGNGSIVENHPFPLSSRSSAGVQSPPGSRRFSAAAGAIRHSSLSLPPPLHAALSGSSSMHPSSLSDLLQTGSPGVQSPALLSPLGSSRASADPTSVLSLNEVNGTLDQIQNMHSYRRDSVSIVAAPYLSPGNPQSSGKPSPYPYEQRSRRTSSLIRGVLSPDSGGNGMEEMMATMSGVSGVGTGGSGGVPGVSEADARAPVVTYQGMMAGFLTSSKPQPKSTGADPTKERTFQSPEARPLNSPEPGNQGMKDNEARRKYAAPNEQQTYPTAAITSSQAVAQIQPQSQLFSPESQSSPHPLQPDRGWFLRHHSLICPWSTVAFILFWILFAVVLTSFLLYLPSSSSSSSLSSSSFPHPSLSCNRTSVISLEALWIFLMAHMFVTVTFSGWKLWNKPNDARKVKSELLWSFMLGGIGAASYLFIDAGTVDSPPSFPFHALVQIICTGLFAFCSGISPSLSLSSFLRSLSPRLRSSAVSFAPLHSFSSLSLSDLLTSRYGFVSVFEFMRLEFQVELLLYWKSVQTLQHSLYNSRFLALQQIKQQQIQEKQQMEMMKKLPVDGSPPRPLTPRSLLVSANSVHLSTATLLNQSAAAASAAINAAAAAGSAPVDPEAAAASAAATALDLELYLCASKVLERCKMIVSRFLSEGDADFEILYAVSPAHRQQVKHVMQILQSQSMDATGGVDAQDSLRIALVEQAKSISKALFDIQHSLFLRLQALHFPLYLKSHQYHEFQAQLAAVQFQQLQAERKGAGRRNNREKGGGDHYRPDVGGYEDLDSTTNNTRRTPVRMTREGLLEAMQQGGGGGGYGYGYAYGYGSRGMEAGGGGGGMSMGMGMGMGMGGMMSGVGGQSYPQSVPAPAPAPVPSHHTDVSAVGRHVSFNSVPHPLGPNHPGGVDGVGVDPNLGHHQHVSLQNQGEGDGARVQYRDDDYDRDDASTYLRDMGDDSVETSRTGSVMESMDSAMRQHHHQQRQQRLMEMQLKQMRAVQIQSQQQALARAKQKRKQAKQHRPIYLKTSAASTAASSKRSSIVNTTTSSPSFPTTPASSMPYASQFADSTGSVGFPAGSLLDGGTAAGTPVAAAGSDHRGSAGGASLMSQFSASSTPRTADDALGQRTPGPVFGRKYRSMEEVEARSNQDPATPSATYFDSPKRKAGTERFSISITTMPAQESALIAGAASSTMPASDGPNSSTSSFSVARQNLLKSTSSASNRRGVSVKFNTGAGRPGILKQSHPLSPAHSFDHLSGTERDGDNDELIQPLSRHHIDANLSTFSPSATTESPRQRRFLPVSSSSSRSRFSFPLANRASDLTNEDDDGSNYTGGSNTSTRLSLVNGGDAHVMTAAMAMRMKGLIRRDSTQQELDELPARPFAPVPPDEDDSPVSPRMDQNKINGATTQDQENNLVDSKDRQRSQESQASLGGGELSAAYDRTHIDKPFGASSIAAPSLASSSNSPLVSSPFPESVNSSSSSSVSSPLPPSPLIPLPLPPLPLPPSLAPPSSSTGSGSLKLRRRSFSNSGEADEKEHKEEEEEDDMERLKNESDHPKSPPVVIPASISSIPDISLLPRPKHRVVERLKGKRFSAHLPNSSSVLAAAAAVAVAAAGQLPKQVPSSMPSSPLANGTSSSHHLERYPSSTFPNDSATPPLNLPLNSAGPVSSPPTVAFRTPSRMSVSIATNHSPKRVRSRSFSASQHQPETDEETGGVGEMEMDGERERELEMERQGGDGDGERERERERNRDGGGNRNRDINQDAKLNGNGNGNGHELPTRPSQMSVDGEADFYAAEEQGRQVVSRSVSRVLTMTPDLLNLKDGQLLQDHRFVQPSTSSHPQSQSQPQSQSHVPLHSDTREPNWDGSGNGNRNANENDTTHGPDGREEDTRPQDDSGDEEDELMKEYAVAASAGRSQNDEQQNYERMRQAQLDSHPRY